MRLFVLILLLLPVYLQAQLRVQFDTSIDLLDERGNTFEQPWTGGLNSVQYNTIDLNQDNKPDLVLFDKIAQKVLTFLQEGARYVYNPEYEFLFPSSLNINSWMLLRDYNCDGLKDLFIGDKGQIRLYKNETDGTLISWKPVTFFIGDAFDRQPVIFSFREIENEYRSITMSTDDVPSIGDVDGDGDLDIFNMRNRETIEFHKNLAVENYGTCDSVRFVRQTAKWGNFQVCGCGHFDLNNTNCNEDARTKHSEGRFLLAGEFTGDDKTDLLFSQAECDELFVIENTGTIEQPMISSIESMLSITTFPSAFYEDVNFDGVEDLLVSPTMTHRENNLIDLAQSNWFLRNTKTSQNPEFTLATTNFLQQDMLDLGDDAVPAFTDADGDGDLDLFVSANANAGLPAKVVYFVNDGTMRQPAFQIHTTDYLALSSKSLYNLRIQFADIDQNGTNDLIFTATAFENNLTNAYFIPNESKNKLQLDIENMKRLNIPVTASENIHVVDIDNDNLPDILLGRNNGALEYWRNKGSASSPEFTLGNGSYLGRNSSIEEQNLACETADFDGDGKIDLVFSGESGKLKFLPDFRNNLIENASLLQVSNEKFQGEWEPNLGGKLWPVAVDLYHTGYPLIVVGTSLGGIRILKNESEFYIFPNLYTKGDLLHIKTAEDYILYIYNSSGQLVSGPHQIQKNESTSSPLPDLAAGFYILRFKGNNNSFSRKIVVR